MVALISKRMISRSVLEKREQAFGFTSDWRRMLPRVFFAFFFFNANTFVSLSEISYNSD